MSATAHTIGETQGRDEPAKLYERYIFEHPEICSSCHVRIKSDHERVIWGTIGHDQEDKDPIPEHLQDGDRESYGELALYPTRTVCDACGSVAGRAPDDTLSRRQALNRCDALADRLVELGEPIEDLERRKLKRAVRILKSDSRIQGKDKEIFTRATKVTVEHARRRDR